MQLRLHVVFGWMKEEKLILNLCSTPGETINELKKITLSELCLVVFSRQQWELRTVAWAIGEDWEPHQHQVPVPQP